MHRKSLPHASPSDKLLACVVGVVVSAATLEGGTELFKVHEPLQQLGKGRAGAALLQDLTGQGILGLDDCTTIGLRLRLLI